MTYKMKYFIFQIISDIHIFCAVLFFKFFFYSQNVSLKGIQDVWFSTKLQNRSQRMQAIIFRKYINPFIPTDRFGSIRNHESKSWISVERTFKSSNPKCYIPPPMTDSIVMWDASISRVNSRTAWLGSSYVWGSTYVLYDPGGGNKGTVAVKS